MAVLGGKAVGLARLLRTGAEVPPFFVIPAGRAGDPEVLDAAVRAWREAGWQKVAVRSSAVGEDAVEHSFAGMFETVLGVSDEAGLRAAIARCAASGDRDRVRAYLRRAVSGDDSAPLPAMPVAVVVQEMVEGDVSGVLFTRDPADPDRALISSTWGLGEGVVQGKVPADTYRVALEEGVADVEVRLADKDVAVFPGPDGPREEPVPDDRRRRPSLPESQARRLARLGRKLERELGGPQDIEWTLVGTDRLVLLQARPIARPVPRGRRLLWDNSNIIESYDGLVAPLTYSFASRAYTIVYQLFSEVMGVDRETIRAHSGTFARMIGLIRGRIYYNLDAWYTVVSLLPGYRWNRTFMEKMMGVAEVGGEHAEVAATRMDRWRDLPRLVRLAVKLGWRALRLDQDIARFQKRFAEALCEGRSRELDRMDPFELLDLYGELERRLLWVWSTPIVNDFFVMIAVGLLESLCRRWVPEARDLHIGLLAGDEATVRGSAGLLCRAGQYEVESTAPTLAAIDLARRLDRDEVLAREDDGELFAWLRQGPLAGDVEDWLNRYGDRASDELKLEVPSYRQQPERFAALLRDYVRTDPQVLGGGLSRVRVEAEGHVEAHLSGWRRWLFDRVLRFARKRVRDRENLRFQRTRIFGLVRDLFRALGMRMHEAGALHSPEDIFYLTVDEAFGWVRGTTVTTRLSALVELRREEWANWAAESPPADRFRTWGPVWAHNAFAGRGGTVGVEGDALTGLSACPGLVEGTVRVVTDPRGEPPLDGEVLVAYRTDPGWVPLFATANAILVERGSLLSHSAVVARELGIPTIVGISGLMQALGTGDRVRVDARAGTVTVLARAGHVAGEDTRGTEDATGQAAPPADAEPA